MHRLVMFAVAVALIASAAFAEPQRWIIDSIDVQEPDGIPDRVVVSETRLKLGHSYSDEELQQAVYRIRRLPFVMRASYRLEPSATMPDAHRLVLIVVPMHRFNYALDALAIADTEFTGGQFGPSIGYRSFAGPNQFDLVAGGTSVTEAGGDFRSVVAQYSGYDLFGKGIVLSASASQRIYFSSGGEGSRSGLNPALRVSFPLTQLQSIVGRLNRSEEEHDTLFGSTRSPILATVKLKSDTLEVLWQYDTTDDPFFALRGTTLEAGPQYILSDNEFPSFVAGPNPHVDNNPQEGTELAFTANAARFFPLTRRTTLRAGAVGAASRSRTERLDRSNEVTSYRTDATLTYGFNWGAFSGTDQEMSGLRRGRIELGLIYSYSQFQSGQNDFNQDRSGLTVGFNTRHPWGRVKIDIQYFQN